MRSDSNRSNGAGKSTTMRIALGILSSDTGEITFGGQPFNDGIRKQIGYMPEERGLYPKDKILDQLVFLAQLNGMGKSEARQSGSNLLTELGLGDRLNKRLSELSLGNQQRVQLAASLIHDPKYLILDEPFSGLDPIATQLMVNLLMDRAANGCSIIFSSHQLDLVQKICNRVGILSAGNLVAVGTVDELRRQGPLCYEVGISAKDWYPSGTKVILETEGTVILQVEDDNDGQEILAAAMNAGIVNYFSRKTMDLSELFQGIVENEL